MTYKARLPLLMLLDSIIILFAVYLAVVITYPASVDYDFSSLTIIAVILLVFHHFYAFIFKIYNKMWSYASVGELQSIVFTVTLTVASAALVQFFINDFVIYKRGFAVTWMLYIILLGGSRFIWRIVRDEYIFKRKDKTRTLVVGAGDAGAMVVRQLNSPHNTSELQPVALVDDSHVKQNMSIYELPVIGRIDDVPEIVKKENIEHIVIAIPSLHKSELKRIIEICSSTDAKVQQIPKIEDIMTGKVSVSNLRNVEVEDLLGREPVKLDTAQIKDSIAGQTVMVTGAGGSIGSEICRQLTQFKPEKLILVGHGEYSIYQIHMELKNIPDIEIIPVIGDVKDKARMRMIVAEHRPSKIYHAAAHKHVPLMEYNPHESVKNNVIGTKNVAEAAAEFKVKTFVLVSTDKAVNPTNVMGASKRIAEMVVQSMNGQSETNFVAVRFGNVLGSRGSVIPLFKKQIEAGGPVTVTDPEMTRYFMTIPEASRLVIQAGVLARGGEIFVLDMGEPVKIVDLARNLIKLSDHTEDEIKIEFTGIRPGEKMYEELLGEEEILPGEVYEKIYIGRTLEVDCEAINNLITHFKEMTNHELKEVMMRIVYAENNQIVKNY
ncbi:MAG TPA: nucleoside-diphosphate sugar epimerase/dehydratase [Pseudogracilibacillus sp.]|nr:nucleoside-diphosphate sugar epimerase/dehydratase [Pseudogracilibacillus sp.]